jgi:tRNA nucleotidyltransferase (CCA-adding enzyme)
MSDAPRSHPIPEPVLFITRRLRAAGHPAYVVGGAVRDAVRGRAPRDWDVASTATGAQVAALFPRINPVGLRHDTVGVFHGEMWVEVTRFRDPGVTLAGDLALRDFTLNAMALDPDTGRLIDPLGGAADLAAGRLRACGDAALRLAEDPLRMLRAARFVAELALAVDPALSAAASQLAQRAAEPAAERIRDEWLKLIVGPGVRESWRWLGGAGVLPVLFPAVGAARGVTQNRYHKFDVYEHTLETVARAVPEADVRLAAMFHDLGKPATKRLKDGEATFYNHERVSAEIAAADLERYRFPQRQAERVAALVANHMFHYDPSWSDAAVRRFVRRVSPELLEGQFALRRADSAAAGLGGEAETEANLAALRARVDLELRSQHALKIADLAIDGHEVGRIAGKGAIVGVILRALLERVTDDPALNTPDRLRAAAEALAAAHTPASPPGQDPA